MVWKIYSWTGLPPGCSLPDSDLVLAIAENEAGERVFVRVVSDSQKTVEIGTAGRLEREQTENGEITTFIPLS